MQSNSHSEFSQQEGSCQHEKDCPDIKQYLCVTLPLELLVMSTSLKSLPRDGGKGDLEVVGAFLARACMSVSVRHSICNGLELIGAVCLAQMTSSEHCVLSGLAFQPLNVATC